MERRVWSGIAIGGLTVAWLAGLAVLGGLYLRHAIDDPHPARVADPVAGRLGLLTAGALIVGPLVIAALAGWWRAAGARNTFLVLAGVALVPALWLSWQGWQRTDPPQPVPSPTRASHCVAFSGGTNTCPGG
jgi:hypothetical protein